MSDYTYNGINLTIIRDADHSNRLIPNGYNDAFEGEDYDFEMVATATDDEGEQYNIYWIFSATKGHEPELDSYDYRKIHRIEAI